MVAKRGKKTKGPSNKAEPKKKAVEEELSSEESSDDDSSGDDGSTSSSSQAGPSAPKSKQRLSRKKAEDDSDDNSSSSGSEGSDDESDDEKNEKRGPFFSDENKGWLKPKNKKKAAQLMSSDDEDEDDEFGGDESVDEDMLEVEKQSRMLDAEMQEERAEAEAEMKRTIAQESSIFHLPTAAELELEIDRVVPPSEIRERIENILEVLADFKVRREAGRARTDYTDQLSSDLAELFGTLPELVEYFLTMFGPAETLEFMEASDRPRPLVVRTNTLKARRKDLAAALMKRGVTLDPLASWSKVGLKIVESPVPIGATPEYLAGHYMLQSAASMCPVLALAPQPKERCLDMSAAPGGKTSYMAQLMRNTGVIIANDLKAERQKATVANMHRLGVKNVITCVHDGRKLGKKHLPNSFDRILLDAPCSGLGVISRDPSVKVQRTVADIHKCAHLQKELLLSAIDALSYKSKTGGVMVYSTCSVSVAENEEVVSYALSKRDIKIIDTGLDFGKPGFTRYQTKRFHPSVALSRRFYPHVHNMDGFFVCKIEKLSDRKPEDTIMMEEDAEEVVEEKVKGTSTTTSEQKKSKKVSDKERETKSKQDREPVRPKRKAKNGVSVPPSKKPASKKPRRMNAKVTKPRRRKAQD